MTRLDLNEEIQQVQILLNSGRRAEAREICERLVTSFHYVAATHWALGMVLYRTGDLDAAINRFQEVTRLEPRKTQAWIMLGRIYLHQNELGQSEQCARKALEFDPRNEDAWLLLGENLSLARRLEESAEALEQVTLINPDNARAIVLMGNVLRRQNRLREAGEKYRKACSIAPVMIDAQMQLGLLLNRLGQSVEAEGIFSKLGVMYPGNAWLHNWLGNAYRQMSRLDESLNSYKVALQANPGSAEIYNNIANILKVLGRYDEAEQSYREALRIKPGFWQAHSNLVTLLNYIPSMTGQQLLDDHRAWARQHTAGITSITSWQVTRDPRRPLRVAYLSPDLRKHPVGYFMLPIMQHHDSRQVISIGYADIPRPDEMTALLQESAGEWRFVREIDDSRLADMILSDRVDILVDLAGHTGNNRLGVFARRPAPIQITYLGYPATTGLDQIDYRMSDLTVDPEGSGKNYSEKLLRLPTGFCCYSPPEGVPAVGTLPADENGYITFGSLNISAKLNDSVLALWAEVLNKVPASKLLLFRDTLRGSVRNRILSKMEEYGINSNRVSLKCELPPDGSHMSIYNDIDITLDTFPWNGHTTACESLWMGVPVVTLYGHISAGRMCASVLNQVNLPQLIAKTPDEFVRIASGLGSDVGLVRDMRASLRTRLKTSPLLDGAKFTSSLERQYRRIWAHWCEKGAGS